MFAFKSFLVFTSFVFYSYGTSWSNWNCWSRYYYRYKESELECNEGKGIYCSRKGGVYRIIVYGSCARFCDGHNEEDWKNTKVKIIKLFYLEVCCDLLLILFQMLVGP